MTLLDLYPKCKRCGSKDRKIYQAGVVLNSPNKYSDLISIYRCWCAFCDECLKQAKKMHPDHIYVPLDENDHMPSPSPYYDELLHLYSAVMHLLDGEMNDFKGKLLHTGVESMKPSTTMYHQWLIDTYYK